jgi:uncharacterized protein involved in exopolysaccharide biosynthesis
MSLHQFLLALCARIRMFAVVLIATVLAATVASLLLPKSYKATVSLLVDAKDEQLLNNALRPLILPQERMSYLQTQVDIMTSSKVARRVVQELKLEDDPVARAAIANKSESAGSLEDRLTDGLLRKLKVETSQSNVIQASFSATDPHFAARVANAFAKAYVDTMLELRVEPTREAAAWFDEQLKGLRASLEDSQRMLTEYYQRQGIVVPEVRDNALIQRLKTDLVQGEARLQQLATQYGSNHPQYQRQATENQALREKLDVETRKVVVGIGSSARQSREQEGDLGRAPVLKLKEGRNELTVLRRNVESAERAYDSAMQRSVVSRVESRASQTNVAVLNPAVVPWAPDRPRLALNVLLSVAIGVLLGLSAVVLMEILDRRVRSATDLRDGWNVPLLGVLEGRR